MISLEVRTEAWPIRGVFRIARGARTEARVVVATVREEGVEGRGECVPYARYGESVDLVTAQLGGMQDVLGDGATRQDIQSLLPPGAARNALDCALWDLEAKRAGAPAWELAGVPEPTPLVSAFTISLGSPEEMGRSARAHADLPLLKLKLAGDGDLERVTAVRDGAPAARLIVDANEAWNPRQLATLGPQLARLGVELLEQPLPAGRDGALAGLAHDVPVCADESCHTSADVSDAAGRYDVVNIKLDKAGGLTEALRLLAAAQGEGLQVMVGCMVGTSLGIAPATLLGHAARWVDLDAPLLLAEDRVPGVRFEGGTLVEVPRALWG